MSDTEAGEVQESAEIEDNNSINLDEELIGKVGKCFCDLFKIFKSYQVCE